MDKTFQINLISTYRVSVTVYDEKELVSMLRNRMEIGFSYLYKNYSTNLLGTIMDIIPDYNTACDVLQEAFVKIYRKIDTYDETKSRLYAWMMRLSRNLAIDLYKSKDYRIGQKNVDLITVSTATFRSSFNVDHIGLRGICSQLPKKYWDVIELNYFKGFSHEEISGILDIPLGTVKTRIRSGLSELRMQMKENVA